MWMRRFLRKGRSDLAKASPLMFNLINTYWKIGEKLVITGSLGKNEVCGVKSLIYSLEEMLCWKKKNIR